MQVQECGPHTSHTEVVVATADRNGSWFPDGLRSIPESTTPETHVVAVKSSRPDFNFSRSFNAGLARTRNDVLILNDKVRLERDTREVLRPARERWGEDVYQACPHTLAGSPQGHGWSYDRSALAPFRYAVRLRAPFATIRKLTSRTFLTFMPQRTPADGFSLSTSLITRKAIDIQGPLDERVLLGYDDIVYSLPCHIREVTYYGVPKVIVYHAFEGARSYADPRVIRSHRRFAEKGPKDIRYRALDTGPRGKLVE